MTQLTKKLERNMKILATVKRVIDYNVQIRVKPDGSGVEKRQCKDVNESSR